MAQLMARMTMGWLLYTAMLLGAVVAKPDVLFSYPVTQSGIGAATVAECVVHHANFGSHAAHCSVVELHASVLGKTRLVLPPQFLDAEITLEQGSPDKLHTPYFAYHIITGEDNPDRLMLRLAPAVFVVSEFGVYGNLQTMGGFMQIAPCPQNTAAAQMCHTVVGVTTNGLDNTSIPDVIRSRAGRKRGHRRRKARRKMRPRERRKRKNTNKNQVTGPDPQCKHGVADISWLVCCPVHGTPCGEPVRSCYSFPAPCSLLVTQTVRVRYTPEAGSSTSDIKGLVALAIAETNLAYVQSRVPIRLELYDSPKVYTYAPDSRDSHAMLNAFREHGTMFAKAVPPDMNVLLVTNTASCGMAYQKCYAYRTPHCFAIVRASCATGYFSFGHELGHLQGADHNMESMPFGRDKKDNHGLVLRRGFGRFGAYRTIMAYSIVDETRVGLLSNPEVELGGERAGIWGKANNAKTLRESRYLLSQSVSSVPTGHPTGITRFPSNTGYGVKADTNNAGYARLAFVTYIVCFGAVYLMR